MSSMLIAGIAAAVLLLLLISLYNKLTRYRVLVQEGWSGIATFLQQRADLVPNLVETVKGYTLHESTTLADVVKWRNRALGAQDHSGQIEANEGLSKALVNFFALAEQYPDLKANSNFLALQNDLRTLEDDLNKSRRYYNGTVRNYNQAIAVFPNNLLAGIFGFTAEPFFKEEEGAQASPRISFS